MGAHVVGDPSTLPRRLSKRRRDPPEITLSYATMTYEVGRIHNTSQRSIVFSMRRVRRLTRVNFTRTVTRVWSRLRNMCLHAGDSVVIDRKAFIERLTVIFRRQRLPDTEARIRAEQVADRLPALFTCESYGPKRV